MRFYQTGVLIVMTCFVLGWFAHGEDDKKSPEKLIRLNSKRMKLSLDLQLNAMDCVIDPALEKGPHLPVVDLFVNQIVVDYRKKNRNAFDYPVGSKFVKKKYSSVTAKEPHLETTTVRKESKGQISDWEFKMVQLPSGKEVKGQKYESCIDCHKTYQSRGFISRESERAMQEYLFPILKKK